MQDLAQAFDLLGLRRSQVVFFIRVTHHIEERDLREIVSPGGFAVMTMRHQQFKRTPPNPAICDVLGGLFECGGIAWIEFSKDGLIGECRLSLSCRPETAARQLGDRIRFTKGFQNGGQQVHTAD